VILGRHCLDPDDDVDKVEPQFTPRGDQELDRAPVDEGREQAALGEVGNDRLHPLPIEPGEFLPGHLPMGERELEVLLASFFLQVFALLAAGLSGRHRQSAQPSQHVDARRADRGAHRDLPVRGDPRGTTPRRIVTRSGTRHFALKVRPVTCRQGFGLG
jgi:hypothetical protein